MRSSSDLVAPKEEAAAFFDAIAWRGNSDTDTKAPDRRRPCENEVMDKKGIGNTHTRNKV